MTHGPAAGNRAAGGHAASPGSTGDVQTPVTGSIEVQDSDEEGGSVLVSVQRVSGPELPETRGCPQRKAVLPQIPLSALLLRQRLQLWSQRFGSSFAEDRAPQSWRLPC